MDLLAGMGRDELRAWSWVAAAVLALAAGAWRPRGFHWAAVGFVMLFAALNAGAGIYVLNHVGDSRWSTGAETPLSAPPLAETPVVGQFLGTLDSTLHEMVGGVNAFLAFQQALPVALDFFARSGWALLVAFPLAMLAGCISYAAARGRRADFEKYRAAVDLLRDELDQIKREISSGGPAVTASPLQAEGTGVRPGPTHKG